MKLDSTVTIIINNEEILYSKRLRISLGSIDPISAVKLSKEEIDKWNLYHIEVKKL